MTITTNNFPYITKLSDDAAEVISGGQVEISIFETVNLNRTINSDTSGIRGRSAAAAADARVPANSTDFFLETLTIADISGADGTNKVQSRSVAAMP